MKRFIYLIIWLLLPLWALAQTNISAVEYWYDSDYGTAVQQTVTLGASVTYTNLLDVSSLEPGLHTFTIRFQDTRGIWGSVLTQFFTYYPGSDVGVHLVTDAEYWYDGDYASAVETPLTPGASVDLNSLLDVSSLINGLHTVTVRFKDDRGIWSSPMVRFFKKEGTSGLKQLIAAEYWFNDDYSSKHDSSFAATSSLNLTGMLDIFTLREGFNFVSLRVQDEAGKWGPVASWFFTKENPESLPQLHQITALEYWFDGDYSTVQNDPVSATSLLTLNTDLDVSALDDGLHTVSTRYRDEAGNWSPAFSQLFSKYPVAASADLHQLVSVEYWIDGDIGSAVKTAIPAGSEYMLDTQLDLSALSDGLHFISYRFQDEAGIWSAAYSHLFSKYEEDIHPAGNKIIAYRYWANDQFVSATEVTLTTPVQTLDLDELIDISSLPGGTNDISFQFVDSVGNWSSALTKSYTQDYNPRGTITAQTNPACTNSTATFTAETMDADSIYWDFGDGTALVGRLATEDAYHIYQTAGDYTVTATLLNVDSVYTNTATTSISVNQSYGIAVVAPENLIAYYPFDGDASDASGNGHDGSVNGASLTEDRNGNTNSAYLFDGNDGILIPHSDELNMSGPLSFSCWIKPAVLQNAMIFGKSNYTSATNYLLRMQSGNIQWEYNGYLNTTTNPLEANNWYHIVVTANSPGGYRQVFVNGQLVAETNSSSGPFGNVTNPFTIGYASRSAEYFRGAIDDVRIFDTALLAEEVYLLYRGTEGAVLPPIEAEICATDTPYIFGSQLLTESGTYYESHQTVMGCDSVVQLNLTIHPTYNDTIGNPLSYQIDDDFEADALGTLPDGWVIRYDGTGAANQKVVNDPVKNGIKSFQVSGSGWAANMSKPITAVYEESTLEGWMYVENVSSGGRCGISIGNSSIGDWGAFLGRIETYNGNLITFYHTGYSGGYGTQYVLQAATSNTWYHVKIDYNFSTGTYKVFIDNEQATGTYGSETRTEFPILAGVTPTTVEMYGNSMVYFDDVKLYESGEAAITICSSETPYTFGTQQLTASGTYTETFYTKYGCDSILTLKLIVNPTYETPLTASICEGNSYLFNGNELVSEGIYKDTLQTVNGCDSILTLTLTVEPAIETQLEADICEGDTYGFAGEELYADGIYRDTLQTVSNCDSIIVLTLNVNPIYEIPIDTAICEGENVSFAGETLTTSGSYRDTLQSALLCDSVIVLNLQVNPVYSDTSLVAICEDDSYSFGGTTYNATGNYVHTFSSVSGCDSVVTLQLTVNPTVYDTVNATICQGDVYLFNETHITTDGEYNDTIISESGCDSIVTLNLTVNPTFETPFDVSICDGDSYNFGGELLASEGIYRDTLQSVTNCDSVIVLNLTVNPIYEIPANTAICSGSTYSFGDDILSESGIYRDTLQSVNNCDSIIVLTLTVNDTFNINDTITICESELPYSFGEQTLLTAGKYTETFTTIYGCDSVVNLAFYVNDTIHTAVSDTICENNLPYVFGNQSLLTSGSYTETFISSNGCDSVVTLALTVHESYTTTIDASVQVSELPYIFWGEHIYKTGVYNHTLSSVFGCDSVISLNLLVEDNIPPSVQCNSIDVELSSAGTYTLTASDKKTVAAGSSDNISAFNDLKISVTPSTFNCENLGENEITVQIIDAAGNRATCQTTVNVLDVTAVPKIDDVTDYTIDEDSILTITLTGISGGTQCQLWPVSISATYGNQELISVINVEYETYSSTATLELVPVTDQNGNDSITISVLDSMGNSSNTNFLLTVNEVNDAPVILQAIDDQELVAEDSVAFAISTTPGIFFDDIDDSTFIFSFTNDGDALPDWISVLEENEQYQFTMTPTATDTGCFSIVVSIQDLHEETVSDTFNVCVDALEVAIKELENSSFEINIYPNPSPGIVNIDLTNPPEGKIELLVTNIAGSKVLQNTYQNNERIVFDLSDQISGTYLVILYINKQRIVRKLILDKK